MAEPEAALQPSGGPKQSQPCHGQKGHFARCANLPPRRPGQRVHRKRKCEGVLVCPPNSVPHNSPKGRGQACVARTGEGARFVPMKCVRQGESETIEPSSETINHRDRKPNKSSKAKRAAKRDWSKCNCPEGAEKKTSAKGRTQCIRKDARGRASFVKAICPEPGVLKGLARRRSGSVFGGGRW